MQPNTSPVIPVIPNVFVELGNLFPDIEVAFNDAVQSIDPESSVLYLEIFTSAHPLNDGKAIAREYRVSSGEYANRPELLDPSVDDSGDESFSKTDLIPTKEYAVRPELFDPSVDDSGDESFSKIDLTSTEEEYFNQIDRVLETFNPRLAELIAKLQPLSPEAELFANIRVAINGNASSPQPSGIRALAASKTIYTSTSVCGRCDGQCKYKVKSFVNGVLKKTKCGSRCACS